MGGRSAASRKPRGALQRRAAGSGASTWVAALICALIRKLNTCGFLYLKLLGVDVYALTKADAEAAEEERAAKRQKASKPQASGAQEDPICLE